MDMDKYYPYNSVGSDRVHDADDLARILRALITDGVAMASATHLQALAAGDFNVTVKAGTVMVQGRIGVNESDKAFTIAAPFAGSDRIDRLVARADYANRKSEILYLQGTPASTPLPPALKNDADGFDIALAQIYVSKTAAAITQAAITDERAQCGIVIPGNLSAMLVQMQAEFDDWFTLAKDTLSEDAAGNLLNLVNALRGDVTGMQTDNEALHATDEAMNAQINARAKKAAFQAGSVAITVAAGATASVAVTFASAFPAAPKVLLTISATAPALFACAQSSVSATGFTARLASSYTASTTTTLHWLAFCDEA